jgi:hypothetical protein
MLPTGWQSLAVEAAVVVQSLHLQYRTRYKSSSIGFLSIFVTAVLVESGFIFKVK